jgi:hypothetical protein
MRRGRTLIGVIAALAAAAVLAPGAGAATPQDICKDLQQHGRLTHQYTIAEIAAFKRDASVQGYCFLTVTPKTTSGVAGALHSYSHAQGAAPLAASKVKAGLPFTGAQLTVALIIGAALLAAGLLLRTAGRHGRT